MGKLNPGLYSSEDHGWMTPPDFIDALLKFEGIDQFDLDPCCLEKNIPAKIHYQEGVFDGLVLPWAKEQPMAGTLMVRGGISHEMV